MQAWIMGDVPASADSRVVYRSRDTAVSSLLSQGSNSSFPVALKLLFLLFTGHNSAFASEILEET